MGAAWLQLHPVAAWQPLEALQGKGTIAPFPCSQCTEWAQVYIFCTGYLAGTEASHLFGWLFGWCGLTQKSETGSSESRHQPPPLPTPAPALEHLPPPKGHITSKRLGLMWPVSPREWREFHGNALQPAGIGATEWHLA